MATTENGTYYPSDYSSVADVPEDMKKMAESIDANKVQKIAGKGLSTNDFTNEYKQKLENLENYNDTEIKKSISQIKEAIINVETEQAKSLHIEDASTVSSKLEVEGNAEQEVTETENNVFNGNLEVGSWDYNTGEKTTAVNAVRSVDYIDVEGLSQISIVAQNEINFTDIGVRYYSANKEYIGRTSINDITNAVSTTINNNLDDTKTVKYMTLNLVGTTDTNTKIAINKNVDLEWHDFIPNSPSPNYSSKIKCLGSNKNELNIEEIESNSNTNVINNQNGILELQGIEGYYKGVYIEKQLKPKTTYTICANLTEVSNNAKGRIGIGTEVSYNNASIATLDFDVATEKKEINFTTNETGIVYIMFVCNWAGNSGHVKYENIKLEEGTVATSYSPYRTR